MLTRRTFTAAIGSVIAATVAAAHATAAPPDIDPSAVALLDQTRIPTRWGTALPGIATRFVASGRQLALTFDACQGACDGALLDTLARLGIPATTFLCSRWIDANPATTDQLIANPLIDIGNHGTRHLPLSVSGRSAYGIPGTKSAQEAVAEVWTNHQRLTTLTGRAPTWFRPGTAHYDDVAVDIVRALGEQPLGFSVNADDGATAPAAQVQANLAGAAPGSIVLAHMNHPRSGTAAGMTAAITDLRTAGWEFVSLTGQSLV